MDSNRRPSDFDDDWQDEEFDTDDESDESTIACPYCQQQIYEDSVRCPHCGQYISEEDSRPPRVSWWIVLGVLLCLAVVLLWMLQGP